MLKTASVVLLLVGSCLSGPTALSDEQLSFDRTVGNIKGLHFQQHEQSVNAARKGAAERLTKLSGSSGANPCGPVVCYSSSGYSDNSDAETLGQGIVGFTDAGTRSSSSSSKYQSSSQHESSQSAMPVYPAGTGSKSSYYSSSQRSSSSSYGSGQPGNQIYDAEGFKSRSNFGTKTGSVAVQQVPVVAYPIGQGVSQSSYSDENRRSSTGYYSPQVDNTYSSRASYAASTSSASQPVVPVYSSSEQASKYVSSSQNENAQRYVPSNTYTVYSKPQPVYTYIPVHTRFDSSSHLSSGDSSTNTQQVPVYVGASSSDISSQTSSDHRSSARYTPVYQPIYSNQVATAQRTSESSGQRIAPVFPVSTSSSSNRQDERYQDFVRKGNSYAPIPVPDVSVRGSSSSSASEAQRSGVPAYYAPPAQYEGLFFKSASSTSASEAQRSGGPAYYAPPAQYEGLFSTSSASNQQRSSSGHNLVRVPITGDALGTSFGAGSLGRNDDLNELMTESERLAKVQAQNAHSGAVSGSAAIDTQNRFGGENVDGVSTVPGGFKRTKSWSSSSKWASGQKYGEDGKVKSYSSLSTAESERHNVNGKTTGYKAATTTLEDDGKVSTYSLHTP